MPDKLDSHNKEIERIYGGGNNSSGKESDVAAFKPVALKEGYDFGQEFFSELNTKKIKSK